MKLLFTCLLVGCLVSPVCAQERNWTLEEFVQKLEDGLPWTREKAEAQLGVKLTKTSSTGVVTRWYPDPGLFVYGEGLIVNAIFYTIWAKTDEMEGMRTNEMRSMRIGLDDQSSCFTQERIKKSYPGGEFTGLNDHPGGSDDYWIKREWWGVTFAFGYERKYKCLTEISINMNRVINIVEEPK